ncbi:MFS transporter [Burkholderia sp. Ac-20365]|uniref:MFS transporter n=1 Tax=Burkholderia sp. Ac-20365 TaxID=2703897 RepID=UPI001F1206DF|nr:MFS transporter [Burkholderia sp. Ac-20365]
MDTKRSTEAGHSSPKMLTIAIASFIGSAIEWFDFFLYGITSALVFGKLYFPGGDPLTGTLLAFGTFAVGFIARPFGGIVAGHLGDRVGRKFVLVTTLLAMGMSTTLIGLVPSYSHIGLAAPVLLILLRIVQGLAVGGEWGGAALIAVEHANPNRRGLYGSFPQMGLPAGLCMAVGGMELASRLPEADFLAWGWRIPFLFSAVLVAIGLVIRLRIEEPPAFRKVLDTDATVKLPIVEAVRRFPRAILLSAGLRFADNILYYVFTTFGLTYMTSHLGLPRKTVLVAILIAAALELLTKPFFGALSDKVGRKQVVVFGALVAVVAPFPFFQLVGTGNPTLILLAEILVLSIAHAAVFSPLAAWFAEMFSPEVRYSGVTIGFQLGALVAGAPTPLIATALLARYADYTPVAIFAMIAAGITLVCALFARVANDPKAPPTHTFVPATGANDA